MKRPWTLLIVLCSLGAIGNTPAGAVQLQAGWYARFGWNGLYGYDGLHHEWGTYWYPTSNLGIFGPVTVTDGGPLAYGRTITVTAAAEVPAGVLFEDSGTYTASAPYFQEFQIEWMSNYDATKLQLQVIVRRADGSTELAWAQTSSGEQLGSGNALVRTGPLFNGDQAVFRLVVVPEPSALAVLALGMAALLVRRRSFPEGAAL